MSKRILALSLLLAGCGASTSTPTASAPPPTPSSTPTPSGPVLDVAPSNNALAALQNALNTVTPGTTIVLHPGTYVLSPPTPSSGGALALVANGVGNFTLAGNGANILITNPRVGFLALKNCTNVTVENLTLDYSPLPFSQGTITQVIDDRTFEVTLQEGFPSILEDWFVNAPEKWGLLRDSQQPLRVKAGALNVYPLSSWTQAGDIYTVVTNGSSTSAMQRGDTYVQLARHDGSPAFQAQGCQSVTYRGITINASPAAGFIALACSQMVYRNNRIEPAGKRFHSTCADGIFQVQGAIGPLIENNTISTNGDDGIIVKTIGSHETNHTPDNKTFTLQSAGSAHFNMAVGDHLEVYNPQLGQLLGSGNITHLSNNQATLDSAIPGVTPVCYFYNQNECLSNFLIRGNQLTSNRRWGIFCCSRNGLIAENNILNSNAQAIMLMNADQGMQDDGGMAPANVTLRDNQMTDCFLQTPGTLSNIQGILSMVIIGKKVADPPASRQTNPVEFQGNRNITLTNNTIDGFTNLPALSLQCANGVTVLNNHFLRGSGSPTVLLNNANNVNLQGNGITPSEVQVNPANTTNLTGP